MRCVLAVAVLAAVGSAAVAEDLKDILLPARYGISPSPDLYPQGTAKEALATAVKLLEKQRYAYLLAHVVDPGVVDGLVQARVREITPAVEKRLAAVREDQKRSLRPDTPPDDVVPYKPAEFAVKVRAEAEREAFGELVRAMQENLAEFPENVPQLAAILRDGAVAESGPAATAEAKGVANKKVYLKQVGVAAVKESRVVERNPDTNRDEQVVRRDPVVVPRWFLEDRQQDTEKAKPSADKAPPEK